MAKPWKIECKFEGGTFNDLREIATRILQHIANAKSYKDIPFSGACGSEDHTINSYFVKCESPIEAQIIELRREADELEKSLKG